MVLRCFSERFDWLYFVQKDLNYKNSDCDACEGKIAHAPFALTLLVEALARCLRRAGFAEFARDHMSMSMGEDPIHDVRGQPSKHAYREVEPVWDRDVDRCPKSKRRV